MFLGLSEELRSSYSPLPEVVKRAPGHTLSLVCPRKVPCPGKRLPWGQKEGEGPQPPLLSPLLRAPLSCLTALVLVLPVPAVLPASARAVMVPVTATVDAAALLTRRGNDHVGHDSYSLLVCQ